MRPLHLPDRRGILVPKGERRQRNGLDGLHPPLAAHRKGKGAKYTRSRLPVALAYREETADKSAALRREAAIKRLDRREKLALVAETEVGAHGDSSAEGDGQPAGGQPDL